jgi:alkylation response protein AidB-like acyl-CoA dehydrogenase
VPHRESGTVQRVFALSEAAVEGVDLHAQHILDEMWAIADGGRSLTPRERARARAVLCNTAHVAAAVVDDIGDIATGDAIWSGSPLERCLRDARTHRMHASIYPAALERIGRLRLGIADDDPLV